MAQVYIGMAISAEQFRCFRILNFLATTTVTLAIAPSPVAYGKPVTLTATVIQNNPTAPIPVNLGQVVFCSIPAAACNSQFNLGSAQLNATGVASLPIYPGAVGLHTYEAVFVGTSTAAAATSPTESVTVTGTFPTATTLTATGNPGQLHADQHGRRPGSDYADSDRIRFHHRSKQCERGFGDCSPRRGTPAQTLAAANGSPLTTGTLPYAVATGDFNGDRFADLAVENYTGGTVSVFLGNGDGTFKPQVTYAVGGEPEGIVAADVNGDGKLDLVVTNTDGASVSVLLGNGDGTFQGQVNNATDDGSGHRLADFNNDGKPDIATSNFYSADVTVLLGNGDGTFQQGTTYTAGN